MLLPTSETAVLILLAVSMLCLGVWGGVLKSTKKWRFELFAYDFAWGAVLAALVAAFTLGSWDSRELTFQDNFLLTGYRKMAWALGSGVVFSLANLLLMASTSISGMTVAFTVTFSVAWALGAVWMYFANSQINPLLAFGGAGVLLVAAVVAAIGYRWHLQAEEHKTIKALRADPRLKEPASRPAARGVVLAVVAGLFFGIAYPALNNAVIEDTRVSSYGTALLISAGIFGSSILFVPFFLNFPVLGQPLQVKAYFKGAIGQHLKGLLAGVLWISGMLAWLVTGEPDTPQISQTASYAMAHGAPVLAALLGMLIWREFRGTVQRSRLMFLAMLVLFVAGLGLVAVAPLYGS